MDVSLREASGSLKRTVRNRARVEGSIHVEAYLINELATYCSLYYEKSVEMRLNCESRNFAPECESSNPRLRILKTSCHPLYDKAERYYLLGDEDFHKAYTYFLLNYEEFQSHKLMKQGSTNVELITLLVMSRFDPTIYHLKVLAQKPMHWVWRHPCYFVNVQIIPHIIVEYAVDYYGLLEEVLEIEYHGYGLGRCIVPIFKCTWFDTVNDNPFILASQAEQVYYVPYPSNSLKDSWSVVKTKPRGYKRSQIDENVDGESFFQENDRIAPIGGSEDVDERICLVTEEDDVEVANDGWGNWHVEESSDEEEKFQDSDNDFEDEEPDLHIENDVCPSSAQHMGTTPSHQTVGAFSSGSAQPDELESSNLKSTVAAWSGTTSFGKETT
ncbi:hypothetical protein OSB04_007123 [Centaurea solstitialis]|uniref:DUF4218 domain-containing protein n=1 Tax=Centaurea solstitialis TaxID=347529 RepID=A0AA38TRY3_9ASTR|nr:hypothetical protein OSB04_007123 [Centaurea solstitialis]